MSIRDENDTLSNVSSHKHKYFKKQDPKASTLDFNRFIFMQPGKKDNFYDWRLDFSKLNANFSNFVITQEKHVNRPDAISFELYGNAKYWWIIAMANDINDPFIGFYKGRTLRVPELNMFKKDLGL